MTARRDQSFTSRATGTRLGEISLVVPVLDEAASLAALIGSIRCQSRAPDEVVLVDGGSTDGTVALADALVAHDPRYRILEAGPATPGRGRNVGIEAATHDWIALTDAGIVLEPGWLAHLEAAALAKPAAWVAWGTYEPRVSSFLDSCASAAYVPPMVSTPAGHLRGPCVASCLLHRHAWELAGGFPDLRAAEDLVFIERLDEAGVVATWAPKAVVSWSLPASLAQTFRRFRAYSFHNVLAGRQAAWHYGVARMYVPGTLVGLGAIVVDRRLIALLGAGAAARALASTLRRRENRSLMWALNPLRLVGVAAVLAVVDAATFCGWADALGHRARSHAHAPAIERVAP